MSVKFKVSAVGEMAVRQALGRATKVCCSGLEDLGTYLRLATPRLIVRCEPKGANHFELTTHIKQTDEGWDDLDSEGYAADDSPLGCPVYWRAVRRKKEWLYLSTFPATPDCIIRLWGQNGLTYCDPALGFAAGRLETVLPEPDHAE